MTQSIDYARALFALVKENPEKGKEYFKNLNAALERRGHTKLLPRIFAEYQKLDEREARKKHFSKVSSKDEQTRILIELYQKLIHV